MKAVRTRPQPAPNVAAIPPATQVEPRGVLAVASLLFFLSGVTGLIYEVVWFKRFTHVWGASSLALTVVVASFLGGLGLGAFLLGKRADRVERPLRWYGWSEIAIGVLALLIPLEIELLFHVSAALYPLLVGSPLAFAFVRLALTFVVIGPACALMGGTLPFLIKHLSARSSGGSATAWLYAVNTFGAAAGCFFAGFFLLPSLGLFATNLLAVALNLALGCTAVFVSRGRSNEASVATHEIGRAPLQTSRWNEKALLAGAAATGFAALALQIVWTRQLALVLGGTTYAFTAVLFVVLVGIAAGSLLFRFWLAQVADQARVLGGTLLLLVAGGLLSKLLVPQAVAGVASLRTLRDSQGWNAAVCLAASCALQLIPSVAMGILFPWFVHAARFATREIGAGVGRVYVFNTLGSISGAVAATFVLLPRLGTGAAIAVCLGLYFVTWIALLPGETAFERLSAAVVGVALLGMALLAGEPSDPRITSIGQYMYGYHAPDEARADNKVLFYEDGASCSVLVREVKGGYRSLSVNGKTDASDGGGDMPMQLGLAYLPAFLHPGSRDVLVIGFGSGCTSGASLLLPSARVTCCEIEPAVIAAAPYFAHVNHRPVESPDFHVVFNDGRNHVQGAGTRYDLVLSEPSNPWIAGVSNLFTRQFYEEVRARLNEGGILAQWIQTYSIEARDYAAIAATVTSVFPECALLRITKGDTILLASDRPLVPDAATLDRAQATVAGRAEIASDLTKFFGTSDVRSLFLRTLLLDTRGVRRFVAECGDGEQITDLNLRLEFDTPLALFRGESTAPEITRRVFDAIEPGWFATLLRAWGCERARVDALQPLEQAAQELAHTALMAQLVDDALAVDPANPHFQVSRFIARGGNPDEFAASLPSVVAGPPLDASRLGVSLCNVKRFDDAVQVFRALAERYPRSATVWANLAVNLKARAIDGEWQTALAKASELDPYNDFVRQLRAQFGLDDAGAAR